MGPETARGRTVPQPSAMSRRFTAELTPADAAPLMDDKRKAQRQRVLKGGKIIFANGSFTVDCTIRSLSDKGARLQIPTTVTIPDRFTFVDAQSGSRKPAKVIWRKADLIGIEFE